jgi:hypothetical protein
MGRACSTYVEEKKYIHVFGGKAIRRKTTKKTWT